MIRTTIAAATAIVVATTSQTVAQQKPAAPQPAAPQKAAPTPPAAGTTSAWVKLCEKARLVRTKDGKDVSEDRSICLTHHERLDAMSGMVLISAAIRDIEGADKRHLMVMLPLGMSLPHGMQAGIYPKDLWDKVQKGEAVDDSKLTPIKLTYSHCHAAGCTAETEATPDIMKQFNVGAGMIVYAIGGNGRPVAFPVPLNGLQEALAGAPADAGDYQRERTRLLSTFEENRLKAIEEYKKQNEALQKLTPGGADKPR